MKLSQASLISLLNGILLLGLTLCEYFGIIKFSLLFPYLWHKILHILGVVLFMGNMIVGPVWFLFAFYSKDIQLLKFANKLLQFTDLYITIPGSILTVINGLVLASVFGGSSKLVWLHHSVLLMIVMYLLTFPLIFVQEQMYHCIEKEPENYSKINSLIYKWGLTGTIVMIPPTIVFYLMIFKG